MVNLIDTLKISKSLNPDKYLGATIIESGSNSNGSWIKFSDGTMICYHKMQGNTFNCTTNEAGTFYYQDTNNSAENHKEWHYPQQFIDDNITVLCSVGSSAYTMASVGYIQRSRTIGYCVLPYYVSNIKFTWNFLAIGKWK